MHVNMLTHGMLVSIGPDNFVRVYYFVTLFMYTREYLIMLFYLNFLALRPYLFVFVFPYIPIRFNSVFRPNPIPFLLKI